MADVVWPLNESVNVPPEIMVAVKPTRWISSVAPPFVVVAIETLGAGVAFSSHFSAVTRFSSSWTNCSVRPLRSVRRVRLLAASYGLYTVYTNLWVERDFKMTLTKRTTGAS